MTNYAGYGSIALVNSSRSDKAAMVGKAKITRLTFIIVAAAFVLSTVDLFLTSYLLYSGAAVEGNPLLSRLSLQAIGLLKTVGLVALILFYHTRPAVLLAVAAILGLVCAWNGFLVASI